MCESCLTPATVFPNNASGVRLEDTPETLNPHWRALEGTFALPGVRRRCAPGLKTRKISPGVNRGERTSTKKGLKMDAVPRLATHRTPHCDTKASENRRGASIGNPPRPQTSQNTSRCLHWQPTAPRQSASGGPGGHIALTRCAPAPPTASENLAETVAAPRLATHCAGKRPKFGAACYTPPRTQAGILSNGRRPRPRPVP